MSKIISNEKIDEEKKEELPSKMNKIQKINKLKYFFDYNYLNKMNKDKLKQIIIKKNILIFIDEYKFNQINSLCGCTCKFFLKMRLLRNKKFPGCIFLSYDFKDEFQDFFIKNRNCINIYFDEGIIKKNIIYKKMEMKNNILFIPLEKYKSKMIEYKLRSFCQIMEELGAKNIEIEFLNKKLTNTKLNINNLFKLDIIANNLGFNKKNITDNSKDIKYNLDYPDSNTIILNENIIKKNIKNKIYIINENNYYSNLELQYVISARCKHFIEKYSTTFSLDNNTLIDNKLYSKLKKYKLGFNLEYNYSKYSKDYLYIFTKVIFSNNIIDNISSSNLSYDQIGFNYLINTLSEKNFRKKGIYKIIEFIEYYIENLNKNTDDYKQLYKIFNIIKNECSLEEFSELLLNYFSINSEWYHFKNFIELLLCKTISYDKIGYLIIFYNKKLTDNEKFKRIVKFIYKNCFNYNNKNITKNFWEMLHSNDKKFSYYLKLKLDNEYDILKKYNWYGIRKLLHDINNYKIIEKNNIDRKEKFNSIVNNIFLGYSYYEFHNKMIPFIINIYNNIKNEKNLKELINNKYLDLILCESFTYESFNINNVIDLKLLESYINQKVKKLISCYYFIKNIKLKIKNNNLEKKFKIYIFDKEFMKKYKYLNKKIELIFSEISITNKINKINDYLNNGYYNFNNNEEKLKSFIKKVFLYNEKLDLNNIPVNKFGFKLLNNKFFYGDLETEIKNTLIPFIKRIIKKIIEISNINNIKINIFKLIENDKIEEFKKIKTYTDILNYIKNILNKNNIIINDKILNELL